MCGTETTIIGRRRYEVEHAAATAIGSSYVRALGEHTRAHLSDMQSPMSCMRAHADGGMRLTVYWREWSLREARLCAYRGQ